MAGKEPNQCEELVNAIFENDRAKVGRLLEMGADASCRDEEHGAPPLHSAAELGHCDMIEVLLRAGADVSARDIRRNRAPAIHYAAFAGHVGAVEALIRAGSDVNSTDMSGMTPLMQAICGASFDIVALLVQNGANVEARDDSDQTALFHAARSGEPRAVETLIDLGASRDVVDIAGDPPSRGAEAYGFVAIVDLLRDR